MFSKFFIERPIFAAVVAIVTVLLGAVAMPAAADRAVSGHHAAHDLRHDQLSGRQCRHRRQHGGHPDRAAGQRRAGHALHAVLQRLGRHLHADRDLRRRHRHGYRADAGLPAGRDRAGRAAAAGRGPGRHGQAAVDQRPAVRQPDLAHGRLRQPVPDQLRRDQPAERAGPRARRGRGQRAWRRHLQHADLARPAEDADLRPRARRRHPGAAGAERAGRRRPDRHAAAARRPAVPVHDQRARAGSTSWRSSRTSSSRPRPRAAASWCAISDVARVELGCADLQHLRQPDRPAHRRHRDLPAADRQRARRGDRGQGEDGAS